jgi:hypothetical protein
VVPKKGCKTSSTSVVRTYTNSLISLGLVAAGVKATSENGGVGIGSYGAYTDEFINSSGKEINLGSGEYVS